MKLSPDQVVQQALAGLPVSDERVALHSNPGPEHTFLIRTVVLLPV